LFTKPAMSIIYDSFGIASFGVFVVLEILEVLSCHVRDKQTIII